MEKFKKFVPPILLLTTLLWIGTLFGTSQLTKNYDQGGEGFFQACLHEDPKKVSTPAAAPTEGVVAATITTTQSITATAMATTTEGLTGTVSAEIPPQPVLIRSSTCTMIYSSLLFMTCVWGFFMILSLLSFLYLLWLQKSHV